jgi:hypothetical protein
MPIIKHGAHRIWLPLVAQAALTSAVELPYDYLYGNYGVYDSTLETINRATVVAQGSSGAAGGFLSGDTAQLNHYSVAGALVDSVNLSTAAMTAHIPVDITGNTAASGNTFLKGWQISAGDSLEFVVVATTTAGNRSVCVLLLIDSRGA